MVSITLTTHEKKKLQVLYPTTWDEITLGQFVMLEGKKLDALERFSIMTGVDIEIFDNSRKKDLEDLVYSATYFLTNPPDWKNLSVPDKIVVKGKVIKVPTDLGQETVGQSIMFKQVAVESEVLIDLIPKFLAIYLQPLIFGGKFDRTKLEETEELLNEQPALSMYAIANFFLIKPKLLRSIGQFAPHLLTTNLKKDMPNLQESKDLSHSETLQ